MRKITKILIGIALFGCVTVNAQNHKTHEITDAPAFTAIEVNGGNINVLFSPGENYSFTISGPSKLLKATKVKVQNGTLIIDYDEPFFNFYNEDFNINVTAPSLTKITTSGDTYFKGKTYLRGKELNIKTYQNSKVSMKDVVVDNINIDTKDNSSVDLDYVGANLINISASKISKVNLSGRAEQVKILKQGVFAEINTEDLNIVNKTANNGNTKQINKNGTVEFIFGN